jgi:hypothetical protein
MTKMLEGGGLGKRAFRAKISDTQRLLERKTGGHDLAKKSRHLLAA